MTYDMVDQATLNRSDGSQDQEVVLAVRGISKKFCRGLKRSLLYGVSDITTEVLGLRGEVEKLRSGEFWALNKVSLELRRGEALGLVGPNGSGKTTLLRIISGLIKPDAGSVEINGRLAPLIALGAGFNPVLTGRENVYANMSILGLSKQEIDERFQSVIEFADIGDAIDAPLQSYSSGMGARLGFASAIHTEPEILLIDEVLAVGDIRFRARCYRKLHELRQKGTSFVLVNHNPQAILNVCDSAVYLSKGHLIASGNTEDILSKYEEDLFQNQTESISGTWLAPDRPEDENLGLKIIALCFRGVDGEIVDSLATGEPTCFCVGFKASKRVEGVNLHLKVIEMGGESGTVLFLGGGNDDKFFEVSPGEHEIRVHLPYLGLRPGTYTMSVKLKQDALYTFDVVESFRFTVKPDGKMSQCRFYQPRSWELVSKEELANIEIS